MFNSTVKEVLADTIIVIFSTICSTFFKVSWSLDIVAATICMIWFSFFLYFSLQRWHFTVFAFTISVLVGDSEHIGLVVCSCNYTAFWHGNQHPRLWTRLGCACALRVMWWLEFFTFNSLLCTVFHLTKRGFFCSPVIHRFWVTILQDVHFRNLDLLTFLLKKEA